VSLRRKGEDFGLNEDKRREIFAEIILRPKA